MSNIDRAAQIIHEYLQANTLTRDTGNPHALAQALQDAGLLAPDLPGPDSCGHEDALETVAGMRYEYAVQVKSGRGRWMYLDSCGRLMHFPVLGKWCEDKIGARISAPIVGPYRIVRRPVGPVEVCE